MRYDRMIRRALLGLICLSGVACQRGDDPVSIARPATEAVDDEPIRTTDPEIALGNLSAQIHALEARAARQPLDVAQAASLVELLAGRAQYTGSIADRQRAVDIAEASAAQHPADPAALLTRAGTRALFHRFNDALADIEHAAQLGARPAATDAARAAILQAVGRYDDALAIRARVAERRPDIDSLGALASLQAERGETDDAAQLYAAARESYRDVSPFPLAWLQFDEGLMWMRHDDLPRARASFAEAHRRLPSFAPAQCHLAEVEAALGNRAGAIALLRPLAQTSDDPDSAAQLARILGENGDSREAATWRQAAATRYDELIARYPDAYADHAAEFWLGAGNDPRRALVLAQHNLAVRQTARAYELVLAASLAAHDQPMTCSAYAASARLREQSPALAALLARADSQCRA